MKNLGFIFILALTSFKGFSYPQNIAQSYANCITCHVSPSGGAPSNGYGHLALESFIPDKKDLISWMSGYREHREESAIIGYDENLEPKLQVKVGGSLRSLLLYNNTLRPLKDSKLTFIPMLFEANILSLWGKLSFYGSFNILYEKNFKKPLDATKIIKPFSREHWLSYKFSEGFYAKLGRMAIPFGLKTIDHTRSTKSLIGESQQDQYYSLSLDYISEYFAFNFTPFLGNYLKQKRFPGQKEEKGYALSLKLIKPRTFSFGLSSLFKRNNLDKNELDHSLSFQGKLPSTSYFLGEFVHKLVFSTKDKHDFAIFLRLGKYFSEWLDLYVEYGEKRSETFRPYLNTVRIGTKGRLFPWLELEPFIQYKHSEVVENSPFQNIWLALQIHAFY